VAKGMNVIMVSVLIMTSVVRSDNLHSSKLDSNCPPSKLLTGKRLITPRQRLHSAKFIINCTLKILNKTIENTAVIKLNITPADVI